MINEKIKRLLVPKTATILEAIRTLDETHERIVLVMDGEKLAGVLTDSNVRKAILQNASLSDPVTTVMTAKPITVSEENRSQGPAIMRQRGIDAIPVIDDNGTLLDMLFRHESYEEKYKAENPIDVPVVVMAGGKGTRLYPYTQVLPKPLIPIGEETMLEQIMHSFAASGCRRFYLSVNYKKNLIKAYVEDMKKGPAADYDVAYVEEEDFFGTAGSLALVKGRITEPFFVTNCDILLKVKYADVMAFHKEKKNMITVITSLKNFDIPYGVIHIDENGDIERLEEKPKQSALVNTGVYVLDPEVLSLIPDGQFMHITDLIQTCMDTGRKVGVYPVTDKAWEDMGELAGMEAMIHERTK